MLLFTIIFVFQGLFFLGVVLHEKNNEDFSLVNIFSVDIIVKKEDHDNDPNTRNEHKVSDTLLDIYLISNLCTNILIIILVSIFWIKQQKLKLKLDFENLTDADFALIMYNLPENTLSGTLRQHIVRTAEIKNDDIIYLNKCYQYDKVLKLKTQQFKWLQMKTDLDAFRNKLREKGESYEDRHPKTVGLN